MAVQSSVPRIHPLAENVANQIAAGEVVERPASVVKECLENAFDAGADQIRVELDNAGKNLIRIADNGHGIEADDLLLVISSHATSKIQQAEDLMRIHSYGFRGEALASIAAVARFSILSATADAKHAMQLHHQDANTEISPQPRNPGTTVEVRDLFYNTPARKKFLRSHNTEYQHVLTVMRAMALSHFDCRLSLVHNQKKIFDYPIAKQDYAERIGDVLGREFIQHSIAFDFQHEHMRVWGWLGTPEMARNHVDKQYLFINQRLVRDKPIQHAIRMAFNEHLPPGRFPSYVLYVELEPNRVDVNVHPTKQEVRLEDARAVHDFVFLCLQQVLAQKNKMSTETLSVPSVSSSAEARNKQVVRQVREHARAWPLVWQAENNEHVDNTLDAKERFTFLRTSKGWLIINIPEAIRFLEQHQLQQHPSSPLTSRRLLFPYQIHLEHEQILFLPRVESLLKQLGIEIKIQSAKDVSIMSLPETLLWLDVQAFITELNQHSQDIDVLKAIEYLNQYGEFAWVPATQVSLMERIQNLIDANVSMDDKTTHPWRYLNQAQLEQLMN